MPADFVVQSPDVANPPTLFLPLADMAQVTVQGFVHVHLRGCSASKRTCQV